MRGAKSGPPFCSDDAPSARQVVPKDATPLSPEEMRNVIPVSESCRGMCSERWNDMGERYSRAYLGVFGALPLSEERAKVKLCLKIRDRNDGRAWDVTTVL